MSRTLSPYKLCTLSKKATKCAKINTLSPKINNRPFNSVLNLASINPVKSNIALVDKREDTGGPGRKIQQNKNKKTKQTTNQQQQQQKPCKIGENKVPQMKNVHLPWNSFNCNESYLRLK